LAFSDAEFREILRGRLLLFTTLQSMPTASAIAAYFGRHSYSDPTKLIRMLMEAISEIGKCDYEHVFVIPTKSFQGPDMEALSLAMPSLRQKGTILLPASGMEFKKYKTVLEASGKSVTVIESVPTSPVSTEAIYEHMWSGLIESIYLARCYRSTGVFYKNVENVIKAASELNITVAVDESYTFGLDDVTLSDNAIRFCYSNMVLGGLPGAVIACSGEAKADERELVKAWLRSWGKRALNLLASLKESLDYILNLGLNNWRTTVYFKSRVLCKRLSKTGYMIPIATEDYRCPSIVVVRAPKAVEVPAIVRELRRSGIVVDNPEERDVLRIGVMGATTINQTLLLSELITLYTSF